jgi:hypothetical protein
MRAGLWSLFLTKCILKYSVLTLNKTSHARNTCEAFRLKCLSPSNIGHHWPKHVKASLFYQITLLHLMEINPNFTYKHAEPYT